MDSMTCPLDAGEMTPHDRGGVTVMQCATCLGLFIAHADLRQLIEQENEWHVASGPMTQPIPRILPGMTAPPDYTPPKQARSYVDELFG